MKNLKTFLLMTTFFGGFYISWAQQNFNNALNDSIAADGFLYHKLTKSDNYKDLIDLYGISKRKIIRLNPSIRRGFKAGLLIKLPTNENLVRLINQYQSNKTKNKYIVKHQDTKFGISKLYGISIFDLEKMNPKIIMGLLEGDTLFVPKLAIKNLLIEDDNYNIHKVVKGDTFYSLIKKYNVTYEELLTINPILSEGLKLEMLLRIPKVKINISPRSITFTEDADRKNKNLEVLILLPFKTSEDSIPFNNVSTNSKIRNIVSDFYFGTEMAMDSLSKLGIKIHAQVFDTENSIDTINKIFRKHNFSKVDLVVGPLFTKNINHVNKNIANSDAYILSPFSTTTKATNDFGSKIVQEIPLKVEFVNKIVNHIINHYTDEKLILVTDSLPESKKLLNDVMVKFSSDSLIDLNKVIIIKPIDNYIKRSFFQENIAVNTEAKNWVINLSANDVLLADIINTLGVFQKDLYDISLFTITKSDLFNNFDNYFLSRLNFCFPSETYIDYRIEEIKVFEKKYLSRYHNLPSENAVKGFDMVYDALDRLSISKNLLDKTHGITRRMAYQFDYIKDGGSNKILNKGAFLLQYQGLSIKLVE